VEQELLTLPEHLSSPEYIKVGMETTLDVGMDFVENDKGNIRHMV
jgi:hypothetical protein